MSDSPWAVVAGVAKAFSLPLNVVLYEMSYTNLLLYSATLPMYVSDDEEGEKKAKGKRVNASDPNNSEMVSKILSI